MAKRRQRILRLQDYSNAIRAGWKETDLYRAIIHQVPRLFHSLDHQEQQEALHERPALTGTRWDALLAATVEHVAELHGHAAPAWTSERERFLDVPWVVSRNPLIRLQSIAFAPPAFIRHSALPDPRDLDGRGGEPHAWVL